MDQEPHPAVFVRRVPGLQPEMEREGVDKSPFEMAVAGVNHHPGGFVQDQYIIVLIDYIEGNILREYLYPAAAIGHHKLDDIARAYYVVRFNRFVGDVDIAFLYSELDSVTGGILHMLRHIFVDADGGLTRIHYEAEVFEHFLFAPFFRDLGVLYLKGIVQPVCHLRLSLPVLRGGPAGGSHLQ